MVCACTQAFRGKVVSEAQAEWLVLLFSGFGIARTGAVGAESLGLACAAISCAAAIAGNVLVRNVCAQYKLAPVALIYHVAPWTAASTLVALATSVGMSGPGPLAHDLTALLATPVLAITLVANGALSFGVNWFSTWAQTHCSYTGYAVLGQGKTMAAIGLSAVVLAPVSARAWTGLLLALVGACAFTLAEKQSTVAPRLDESKSMAVQQSERLAQRSVWIACVRKGGILAAVVALARAPCPPNSSMSPDAGPEFPSTALLPGSRAHGRRHPQVQDWPLTDPGDHPTAALTTALQHSPPEAPAQRNHRLATTRPAATDTFVAFLVATPGKDVNAVRGCGGCVVLHQLADTLSALGQRVRKLPLPCRHCKKRPTSEGFEAQCDAIAGDILAETGSTNTATKFVVVYPEGLEYRCRQDPAQYVHVLWVLAPMGSLNKEGLRKGMLEHHFAYDDLVFTYLTFNPGSAVPVTHANLLQVMVNPTPTDEFRASAYPPLPRSGTAFFMRKASKFHSTIKVMHKPGDTELRTDQNMAHYVEVFRTHEYVVCYDPYSFYAWIAAQLGCIPIIHPIVNTTKREWLLQSGYLGGPSQRPRAVSSIGAFGLWRGGGSCDRSSSRGYSLDAGYMEYSGAQDAYGIAYGWDEVEYARRTIHLVREQLWAAKSFAHSVTVPRFIRDAQRAARGERDFEGAMWSHDLYPRGWYANLAPKFKNQLGG